MSLLDAKASKVRGSPSSYLTVKDIGCFRAVNLRGSWNPPRSQGKHIFGIEIATMLDSCRAKLSVLSSSCSQRNLRPLVDEFH